MRRTFRRHIRKTLAQDVPPILQEANFAFDKGEYGRAGELFEDIARAADGRGNPRAATYHLQAGRARLLAGQSSLGLPSLKRGLELLAQGGRWVRYHRAGERILAELNARGQSVEAAEIEAWINKLAPPVSPVETQELPLNPPALPGLCPACGASVRSDEVEWVDKETVECAYCGSPIQ